MIETMLTQTYRVACDRCGDTSAWAQGVVDAHDATRAEGFVFNQWKDSGVAIELVLCPTCQRKATPKRGRERPRKCPT